MQTDSQQAQADLLKQQKLTEVQKTITETNHGNKILSDIAISNEQSAKDILVKTQQITSMIKEDDVKVSQKAMLDQQKLTEVQNTAKATYEASTLLVDEHALKQSQKSQIDSQKSLLDQQKLTEVQKTITETNQGVLVADQALMIVAQTAEIAPNAAKQRAVQDAQIAQVTAETSYTSAKEATMVESRIDNLVIEDLKAQMQQIATVGAGGLVPDTHDFSSANSLREALYKRAKGEVLPNITFTASTTYTKAT